MLDRKHTLTIAAAFLALALAACLSTSSIPFIGDGDEVGADQTMSDGGAVEDTVSAEEDAIGETKERESEPAPLPTAGGDDFPLPDGPEVVVNFANTSGRELCHFYITPSAAEDWGTDYGLGVPVRDQSDHSVPGTFPAGIYDIKVEDCEYNIIAWNQRTEIPATGYADAPVEPLEHALTLYNDLDDAICAVYLTRSEDFAEQGWRRNLLNVGFASLPAGESRLFKIGAGSWNVRLETCGGEIIEGLDLTLSGLIERNASDVR